MSAVAGLLSTSNADSNDLVGEFQETILVRNSKGNNVGTTLFGLMSKLKVEPAENNTYNWFERDPVQREIYSNDVDAAAPAAGAADTLTVFLTSALATTANPLIVAGQVLRNNTTGEYVLVTATPGAGAVSITRAFDKQASGGAVPATYVLAAGDAWSIITLGKDEGAAPVRAAYETPETLLNYIQTYNSTVEVTNAFKANKLRTDLDGPLKDRRIQALEKVSKDIEMSFLMGRKYAATGSNGYQYFTGGVVDAVDLFAPQNALDGGGAAGIPLQDFLDWLEGFMTVGSDAKLALCGPQAYAVFSRFFTEASNGFRIMNRETVFGMNIVSIETPFGELSLAFHPLLKEMPHFLDWMFVIDLAHVVQKSMEPLFLEPNIQTPGQDSYKEQYRAKLGLKLKFAEAFGYASSLKKVV